MHLPSQLHFFFLFLFPLLVEGLLVIGEDSVDLLVGVLLDGAAGTTVGTMEVGRAPRAGGRGRSDGLPTRNAVHGDVAIDEDDLKLKDLVLIEVEPFFEGF